MLQNLPAQNIALGPTRIAIFGSRWVAPESIYSLLKGYVDIEVLLYGPGSEELLVKVNSISDQYPTGNSSVVRLGSPSEIGNARIAVISSTDFQSMGETEDEYIERKAAIVRSRASVLQEGGFGGVLIVTTSPVEVMAQVALDACSLNPRRVIGIGPQQASAYSTAGPEKFSPATWCTATCRYKEFVDACHPDCPYFDEMLSRFRTMAAEGPVDRGEMASCVMRVCQAVINDEKAVLPVATMTNGQYGILGVYSTLPCVIGSEGVERVLELPRSAADTHQMLDTARNFGRMHYQLSKRMSAAAGAGH